ncbi:hypothetical protein WJX82_007761 [Trebouxia sp. C0006]
MEATLSFNACHIRRTLPVHHSVRRLTSSHELQQAHCRHRRVSATVRWPRTVHAYSINGSTGNILQQQSWQSDKAGPIISLLPHVCLQAY